jgi:serine protease Do
MVGTFLLSSLRVHPGRLLFLPVLATLTLGLVHAEERAKPIEPLTPPAVLAKPAPESVEDLKAIQTHVRKVIEKVTPAVVGVRIGAGAGSGVIVSADGHVLTAGHVSGEPGRVATLILPDGRQVKAKSLGSNKGIDSGMFKITEEGTWPFVEMGKSVEVKKNQWVITIGHPGGYKPGRSPVVRLGRVLVNSDTLIQTDCTLVGGDSGGPLFDMEGRVVGIHSRIGGTITANIHVPVDTYRDTWDRLVMGETWGSLFGGGPAASGPFLGVEIDRESEGCKIARIVEDSGAAKAGLKADDVILEFDGVKLKDPDDLSAQLRKKKINDEVTLKVQRDKEMLSMKVKLSRRPA